MSSARDGDSWGGRGCGSRPPRRTARPHLRPLEAGRPEPAVQAAPVMMGLGGKAQPGPGASLPARPGPQHRDGRWGRRGGGRSVRLPAAIRRGGGRYPPHAGGDVSTDAAPPPQPPAGSAVTRGAAAAAAPPPCRLGAESTGRGGGETGARRTAGTLRRGPTHRPYGGKAAARRPSSLCARESRRGPRAAPPPP